MMGSVRQMNYWQGRSAIGALMLVRLGSFSIDRGCRVMVDAYHRQCSWYDNRLFFL
jgi:hypothetical protein